MVYEAGVAVAVVNYIVMTIVIRASRMAVMCVRENVSCVCESACVCIWSSRQSQVKVQSGVVLALVALL